MSASRSIFQRTGLVVALALAIGCGVVSAAPREGAWKRNGRAPVGGWMRGIGSSFTTVECGHYGSWAIPTLLAARSECEWTEAMAGLAANGGLIDLPAPNAPEIARRKRYGLHLECLGPRS